MSITIKSRPFNYPNFILLDVPGHNDGLVSLAVAAAFPTDEAAGAYWDSARAGWLEHVKAKRCADNGKR